MSTVVLARYWLRVKGAGEEFRFGSPPDYRSGPTLTIDLIEEQGEIFEQTYTVNIQNWCGAFGELLLVRPRGDGWRLHNSESDKHTVWRRPRPAVAGS